MERLIHGIFCWIALTMFALGAGCYAFGLITTGGGAGSSGDTAGFIGNNGSVSQGSAGDLSNRAYWQSFVAEASGTIGYIHFYVGSFTGGANVAIYDNSGTLIMDGTMTALDATYEWKTIALDSSITITAGTTYRLAFGFDATDTYMVFHEVEDAGGDRCTDTSYTVQDDMSATPSADMQNYYDDLAIYADNTGGNT